MYGRSLHSWVQGAPCPAWGTRVKVITGEVFTLTSLACATAKVRALTEPEQIAGHFHYEILGPEEASHIISQE